MGRRDKKAKRSCFLSQDYPCHLRSIIGIKKPTGISMGLCWAVCDENQVYLQNPVRRDSRSCREGSWEAWHSRGHMQPSPPKHSVMSSKTHSKVSLLILVWYLGWCLYLIGVSSELCCTVDFPPCLHVKMWQLLKQCIAWGGFFLSLWNSNKDGVLTAKKKQNQVTFYSCVIYILNKL